MPAQKALKVITIDTLFWARGIPNGNSLFDPEKKYANQCCLGHLCEQIGVPKKAIRKCGTPEDIYKTEGIARILVNNGLIDEDSMHDTQFCTDAVDWNDHPDISDEERMQKLKKLFKENGFKLQFK